MGSQDQRAQPSCQDEPTSCVNDRFQFEPVLFQGSPLLHSPKGKRSINEFIHLCQAWAWSRCCVSDPVGGHGANSTRRSRPGRTSHPAAARERLAWEGAWSRGHRGAWGPDGADCSSSSLSFSSSFPRHPFAEPQSSGTSPAFFNDSEGTRGAPVPHVRDFFVQLKDWKKHQSQQLWHFRCTEHIDSHQRSLLIPSSMVKLPGIFCLGCYWTVSFLFVFFVLFFLFLRNNIELRLKQKWTS